MARHFGDSDEDSPRGRVGFALGWAGIALEAGAQRDDDEPSAKGEAEPEQGECSDEYPEVTESARALRYYVLK